ncbi:MAG: S8 family serine peptidase [Ignavibacteria bacterium]|nr:S8 family serine peptidase [Ignavibacteria bacterium]
MLKYFLVVTASLSLISVVYAQRGTDLVQIVSRPDHPLVFRGEVFIERTKNTPAERQIRSNWYARGRFILETEPALMDSTAYSVFICSENLHETKGINQSVLGRIKEAIRPFSKAKISKALHRVHPREHTQQFVVTFADVEQVVAIEEALRAANVGSAYFDDDWTAVTGVPNDGVFDPRLSTAYLYSTGIDDQYYHHAHNSRTRAWGWFSIKAPIAWDISRGTSGVVIGITDNFNTCKPSPVTTDLEERRTVNGTGNVRRIVSTTTSAYTNLPVNTGNGVDKSTYPIKTGHGYSVLGTILSRTNNDPHNAPGQGPEGSAAGTCPECTGVLFPLNPPSEAFLGDPCSTPSPNAIDGTKDVSLTYDLDMFDDFDLDFTNDTNGRMKRLDILNCSYVGGNGILHRRLLRNGVAIVAAAGNDWGIAPFDPAATLVMDQQPGRDTKVLAVGSISDGELFGSDCQPWGTPHMMPPIWKGSEQFTKGFVYSPDALKFSLANTQIREGEKRNAYMDVVAPGGNVWTTFETTGSNADPRGYAFQTGTSISTGIVSGIVGLMFSVNANMGVAMDTITDLPATGANGLDVQRKMYDIVTFTADKISDLDPTYAYATQTNDTLRRTWSRRMGFGKINAYRAVTHSIPCKGDYEYTTSASPEFSADVRNADGIRLMHWGARIKDSIDWPLTDLRGGTAGNDGVVEVLRFGGRSLPGQTHNNHGVTRITSTTTDVIISVPDSATLCIDGLLMSEGSTKIHEVRATNDHSTIMAEGLLRNIDLIGRLRISDLIVDGMDAQPTLRFTHDGDIYGYVQLTQRGSIDVNDSAGSCRLRPGSHVRMSGIKNITVRNGSELIIDHASRITRTGAQEIEVKDNASMRVLAGAKTHIGAKVRVRAGSSFIIEDSAVVFLHDLIVEAGGTFKVMEGAHVAFGDSVIDINGHFDVVGGTTAKERIVLTTTIADNCVFDARDHASLNSRTRIRMVGNTPNWRLSSFALQYADMKNVSVSLSNVSSLPIRSCAFSVRRDLPSINSAPQWLADPFMVKASTTVVPADAPESYHFIAILNSSFIDSAGSVPVEFYQAPYGESMKRYRASAIQAQGMIRTDVTGCTFTHLHEGVTATGGTFTTVNSSTFTEMDHGVITRDDQPRICRNTFLSVEYPVSVFNVQRAYHNDNTFANARICFRIENSEMQAFRNNEFSDYWKGIVVNTAVAALTSLRQSESRYEMEMYGRNRFDVPDPQAFMNAPYTHPNPFMRRVDAGLYNADVETMADLAADAAGGLFLVRCGLNRFGTFTTAHVAYMEPEPLTIDFSNNNCRPFAAVRSRNVGAFGAPLNVDALADDMCGPMFDENNCSDEVWRDGRNEIPAGETFKRRIDQGGTSTGPEEQTFNIALSRAMFTDLASTLRTVLTDVQPSDEIFVTGLLGNETKVTVGTYSVEIRRNGAVHQHLLLLVTP